MSLYELYKGKTMAEMSNELVVKSNRLIEAAYRLSITETQLILFAICAARKEQKGLAPETMVFIEAKTFAEQFGLAENNVYFLLRQASNALSNRQLDLPAIDPIDGKPSICRVHWFNRMLYRPGSGRVGIEFHADVAPHISRLEEKFTSYRLENICKMSSLYAIRMYELLVQFVGLSTRTFELETLKTCLGVAGEYEVISDLKKRVFDVAVAQINQHTDLEVGYVQQKTGRKVTHFIFMIGSKKKAVIAKPAKPNKPLQLGLSNVEPAPKSTDPAVLAEREKALAALPGRRKKTKEYDPNFDPATCHPDDL